MHSFFHASWRGALLALAFLTIGVISFVRAETEELGVPAGSVIVPEGLSHAEVRAVVVEALAGRGWGVKSATNERIVAYLKHRGNEPTLTLDISTSQVELHCVGWAINKKTGQRVKPEQPNGWLGNIRKDVMIGLNRAITLKS